MTDGFVQVDVLEEEKDGQFMKCNLYTPAGVVKIYMSSADYKALMRGGFFIRDGKRKDSSGVLNTTEAYYHKD